MNALLERLSAEAKLVYEELQELPPLAFVLLSCLALIFAASVAFGIHP